MKYKSVLILTAPPTGELCHLGINFNGKEYVSTTNDGDTALWTNIGSNAPTSHPLVPSDRIQSNLYNMNRLAAVQIKYYPAIPNGAQVAQYLPMTITRDTTGIDTVNPNTTTIADQMEQVNQVKTKNMYRPFKIFMKAPKYRIKGRIPSIGTKVQGNYSNNQNIAGQWKTVDNSLVSSATIESGNVEQYATHLLLTMDCPVVDTQEENITIGTFVITSYYVYQDRA